MIELYSQPVAVTLVTVKDMLATWLLKLESMKEHEPLKTVVQLMTLPLLQVPVTVAPSTIDSLSLWIVTSAVAFHRPRFPGDKDPSMSPTCMVLAWLVVALSVFEYPE
jgi:hypothetical protein